MFLLAMMLNHCSQTYLCKRQLKIFVSMITNKMIHQNILLIFRKLLLVATGGYFLIKGKYHSQIYGVAMGSPLRPTLFDFFLAQLKNQSMNTNYDFLPAHYCRYVDDMFCVFDRLENAKKKIKFTTIYIQI